MFGYLSLLVAFLLLFSTNGQDCPSGQILTFRTSLVPGFTQTRFDVSVLSYWEPTLDEITSLLTPDRQLSEPSIVFPFFDWEQPDFTDILTGYFEPPNGESGDYYFSMSNVCILCL